MEDNTNVFMKNIFDSELNNYLLLEKTIVEAVKIYEATKDEKIKTIIKENITVAKNEIFILIEIVARFVSSDEKNSFEEKIYAKLDNLKVIEEKLNNFKK